MTAKAPADLETLPDLEERELLWQAILDKIGELAGNRPHGYAGHYYRTHGTRIWSRCIANVHNGDGTDTVYDLDAYRCTRYPADTPPGKVEITVRTYRDDHDEFWEKQLREDDPGNRVVIDHVHYWIVTDPGTDKPDHCRGFGGREHTIEFFDGRTIATRNLWHQGTIPPSWRDRLPDNARFAQDGEGAPEAPIAEPEPEPDPSDTRQIAIDLIHQNIREGAMRHVRIAVAEQYDLKALGREGYAAKCEEVFEHIAKATVTVEIPDEVTE
jgi:hypothetical protein